MTKRLLKAVVLASTLCMVGVAQSTTIKFEDDHWGDSALLAPSMQLSLSWSERAMALFEVMGTGATPVSPGAHQIAGGSMDVSWPVSEISVTSDGYAPLVALTHLASNGGLTLTQPPANNFFTRSGGTLTLSDVRIDFARWQVLADISGGNGLSTHQDVPIWTYGHVNTWWDTSRPSVSVTCTSASDASCAMAPQEIHLLGLAMTPMAFDMFSQGLGLRAGGISALSSITDFGVLTLSPVPEPSTCALMALGLIGLAGVTRRSALTRPRRPL